VPPPVSDMGGARAQYFRDVDDALERADEVHVAIEAAVSNEAYGVAAALRGGLAELEARDTVGSVLQARPLIAKHAAALYIGYLHGKYYGRVGIYGVKKSLGEAREDLPASGAGRAPPRASAPPARRRPPQRCHSPRGGESSRSAARRTTARRWRRRTTAPRRACATRAAWAWPAGGTRAARPTPAGTCCASRPTLGA